MSGFVTIKKRKFNKKKVTKIIPFDQLKRELSFHQEKSLDERFKEIFPFDDYRTKEGRLKAFKKKAYTKKELEIFEEIIRGKLKEAEKNYAGFTSLSQCSTEGGPVSKIDEAGSNTTSFNENNTLAKRAAKFIAQLKVALTRIKNNSSVYGRCKSTGKLINPYRLKLTPHATESISEKKILRGE